MARQQFRLTWQVKLPILLVLFATAPVVVMGISFLDLVEESYVATTLAGLQGQARAKSEAVSQFMDDRTSEVERIALMISSGPDSGAWIERAVDQPEQQAPPLPELQDAEAMPSPGEQQPGRPEDAPNREEETAPAPKQAEAADESNSALERLRQQLSLILWDQKKFEELLVIASDGEVLASTFSEHEGRTAAELDYFRNGLRTSYLQHTFISPITERLTMVIATPIRDRQAKIVGVLAARLNLSRFFRLINDTVGLGTTGETLVGKLLDGEVVFMAPTRHDPEAALTRTVALGEPTAEALQAAARGDSGAGKIVDYRNECAYAAWEHVPALNWALAVKQDCEEAEAAVEEARASLLGSTVPVIGLALLAAFVTARALVQPLRALKSAADRISKGDMDVQLRIPPGDEVGELADSFERIIAAMKFFREQAQNPEREEDALESEAPPSGDDPET